MTDKQSAVTAYLKTKLGAISGIKFVGEMPDDVKLVAQRMPCILLRDGSKEFMVQAGTGIKYEYELEIWLYNSRLSSRNASTNSLEVAIWNAINDDFTLGGNCQLAIGFGSDAGDVMAEINYAVPGQCGNVTIRKLTIKVTVHDAR